MHHDSSDVTALLTAWRRGEQLALERLIPIVHAELHQIARRCLTGERRGHSLQATALVNEAFLRLVDVQQVTWQNRGHFLAIAARLMRRILVDAARARRSQKRGGGAVRITLDDALAGTDAGPQVDLLALDQALHQLAETYPRKARGVELRFFGGLSVEQLAGVLNVSPQTVMRDWSFAKAWLLRELGGKPPFRRSRRLIRSARR